MSSEERFGTRAQLTVWECFRHFAHLDHANAAIHTADVRYSPITFRLAETLDDLRDVAVPIDAGSVQLLDLVLAHRGTYPEDTGR